jgi:hypothetical protein
MTFIVEWVGPLHRGLTPVPGLLAYRFNSSSDGRVHD